MSWPHEERFHWKACPKMMHGGSCDCGGDDFIQRMEANHEFWIENNQREVIVEIADYGIFRLEAASQ